VRRTAYDHVGGFRTIPFSVTEDDALFHAITREGTFTARFPLNSAALVESHGCKTWKQLYRQKKRWFMGGRDMDATRVAVFGLAYVFNVFLLCGMVLPGLSFPWAALALKWGIDFVMIVPALAAFNRWKLIRYYPLFQAYYFFYILVFPIVILFSSELVWKGRTIERQGAVTNNKALT
jgi:cellulose synthase/poly-beta-1,6-N-acetylglucosamine synthase-like glycosyltransferase